MELRVIMNWGFFTIFFLALNDSSSPIVTAKSICMNRY